MNTKTTPKRAFLNLPDWITSYSRSYLAGDLNAGITVGIMLVPQGMAYAMLAGLPPVFGLYASIFPLLIYAFLGTSRQLAVGPVAMDSILVASGVGVLASAGSEQYVSMAVFLALYVGIIQIIMGVFKLGIVVNFLSKPVIAGFTAAAALIIGGSQLQHIFGLDSSGASLLDTLSQLFYHVQEINLPTLIIGLMTILSIQAFKKYHPKLPAPLIVVTLSTLIVYIYRLDRRGVSIVGEIPSHLPTLQIPHFTWSQVGDLSMIALTIAIIAFMEAYSVAKAIEEKHKDYEVLPNRELIAIGAANIFGSLFRGYPVTGGFSRSAVNDQAGAKTQFAAIISASIVLLTLLFLTPLLYYLPKAVLAAIILVAVLGLIKIQEPRRLFRLDKVDFVAYFLTFTITLGFGIKSGILSGVVFSLLMVIYRLSYPHMAVLGKVPSTKIFRNIDRFENIETEKDCLIVRLDAPMFFANCAFFKKRILEYIQAKPHIKTLIIEASGINHIDSSAVQMNLELQKELHRQNIRMMYADVKGPVRDLFHRYGLFDKFGKDNFYITTYKAVEAAKDETHTEDPYALQHTNANLNKNISF